MKHVSTIRLKGTSASLQLGGKNVYLPRKPPVTISTMAEPESVLPKHDNGSPPIQFDYHDDDPVAEKDNLTFIPYSILHGILDANNTTLGEEISAMPDLPDTRLYDYPGVFVARPTWEVVLKGTICALIMLLAIVGNLLVIYIVWRNKRMRTATNFYIVNLALSDLMVTVSCTWVQVVDDVTEGWALGAFFCKFNSFAQGKFKIFFEYYFKQTNKQTNT